MSKTVLVIGANPAYQNVLDFANFKLGAVNRAAKGMAFASGKGINAARALQKSGVTPLVLQFIGGATGDLIERDLSDEKIDFVSVKIAEVTRICTTLLTPVNADKTEVIAPSPRLTARDLTAFFCRLEMLLDNVDAAAICGTTPLGAPENFYARCAGMIVKHKLPLMLDICEQLDAQVLDNPLASLKINAAELQKLTRCDSTLKALAYLRSHSRLNAVGVTDGGNAAYMLYNGQIRQYDLPQIEVVNPIGGGDVVSGVWFAKLLSGASPETAFQSALGAGCASVKSLKCGDFTAELAQELTAKITISTKEELK